MAETCERTGLASGRTPPLNSAVECVLQRCGSGADLLLESAVGSLQASFADKHWQFINARLIAQRAGVDWALMGRPLLTSLQRDAGNCALCSPLGQLTIQNIAMSGSSMEGFMPTVSNRGLITSSSDVDLMVQLGPVVWEETDVAFGCSSETTTRSEAVGSHASADLTRDNEAVPRLRVASTKNPGFVLLYQVKHTQCTHADEHMFSADSLRQLISRFSLARWTGDVTRSGPATTFANSPVSMVQCDGCDLVPCLRASWWPSEEFFQRSRTRDWPPAAVREDIRQFGVHIVPVGSKGSDTELHEFRLSFSRPEVVAAWHLVPRQQYSFLALKFCKAALGPDGKPLKSYYMKTALFWLCQETSIDCWTSMIQGMDMIITYLEKAIVAQYLGCFFWSEINLFRQSSAADLAAMQRTLSLLRQNMTRLLARELSTTITDQLAPIILKEPSQQLTKRQLRVCLARELVCEAALAGISEFILPAQPLEVFVTRTFLRSSEASELPMALYPHRQQVYLFHALTVAPDDIKVQCRLTSLGNDMFSWDAAPLMGLLTTEDLERILGDPAAVHTWLKNRHGLPAGLGTARARADLLLNPSLLAEALRESVSWMWAVMKAARSAEIRSQTPPRPKFEDQRKLQLAVYDKRTTLAVFESLPRHDAQSALDRCRQFREEVRQFLYDPRTRAEYDRLYRHLPDPWRLRQFVFTDSQ